MVMHRRQIGAGAVLSAAGTFAFRYLSFDGFSNDHFLHLARAQQITMGDLPVRNYVESGLPLMEMLSALGQWFGGHGVRSDLVLTCAMFAMSSAMVYVIAAEVSGRQWVAAAAVAIVVAAYPVSYSYPKVFAYALTFAVSWWYLARPSRVRLALLATTVAFAFLLRHDHGVFLGAGSVAAIAAVQDGRERWMAPLVFAAIALAELTPYLVWVQHYEGLTAYLDDAATFTQYEMGKATWAPPRFGLERFEQFRTEERHHSGPVIHVRWADLSDTGIVEKEAAYQLRRLDPVGSRTWQYELPEWSPAYLSTLVRDHAIADTDGIDRATFTLSVPASVDSVDVSYRPDAILNEQNGTAALYYIVWLLPLAALSLAWVYRASMSRELIACALLLCVVQLLIDRSMLRDPLTTRVRDVVVPASALMALLAGLLWPASSSAAVTFLRRTAVVLTLTLAIAAAAAAGSLPDQLKRAASFPRADVFTEVQHADLVTYLSSCSPPGSRFLSLTFAPELYFDTGHGFAGGHESLVPGFYTGERHERLMLERLAAEDVPFVIMDNETEQPIRELYPRIRSYVDTHFTEIAVFPISQGKAFIVLADARRPALGTFGQSALPCFAAGKVASR